MISKYRISHSMPFNKENYFISKEVWGGPMTMGSIANTTPYINSWPHRKLECRNEGLFKKQTLRYIEK